MAEDYDDLYSDRRHEDLQRSRTQSFSQDDVSELGPDDSASQIGRAITTYDDVEPNHHRRPSGQTNDSIATSRVNGTHPRSASAFRNDFSTTPAPSSRLSTRSSRIPTPTTFVPSKKDRVRYSWQSIHEDEPNRPRIHIIKIVSTTATASAGFPQGEAFGFSISQGGRRIAAYNSARLFILQTAALPVNVSQEYALRRRPLAVEIVDEGHILAVLADEHTVNIYDLSHHRIRRIKTIKPDFPTSTIALSSTGGLLAAAYEGGVEIFSLDASALSTDRRAVRAPKMDRLVFSDDGSTLLGTTTRINASSTVVVSVPVFPAANNGVPTHEELKEAWCTGLLNPENIRNSSHATFMREGGSTLNEKLFAWNGLEDTFGILDTADVHYSSVDFPVTISPPLSTCGGLGAAIHSCPSLDETGDVVAMIVNDRTIRLYIVPERAEDDETKVEAHSIDHELDEEYGCPFTEVRWVHSHANLPAPDTGDKQVKGRLIVASPGGLIDPDTAEDSVEDIEGGRIILFDFDPQFAGQPGQTFTLTLGKAPPQMLEEEKMDVATEVALVRRRTVNQSKSGTLNQRVPILGRAATTIGNSRHLHPLQRSDSPSESLRSSFDSSHPPQAFTNRRSTYSVLSMSSDNATRSLPDLLETTETADLMEEPMEEPYTQGAPRSGVSLQRAATAANRHRFQTLEEREAERASNNSETALPLPEYTEEPNAPLPGRYRALAGLDIPSTLARPYLTNGAAPSPVSAINTAPPDIPNMSLQRALSNPSLSAPPPPPQDLGQSASTQTLPLHTADTGFAPVLQTPIPRSLQRAYSNAISPLNVNTFGHGPAPPLIGDWENVSPLLSRAITSSHSYSSTMGSNPQLVGPAIPPHGSSTPFSRMQDQSRNSVRYSASSNGTATGTGTGTGTLHPNSNPSPSPRLAPDPNSNSSTHNRPVSVASTTRLTPGPHRPSHVAAFHSVNAAASLMPSNPALVREGVGYGGIDGVGIQPLVYRHSVQPAGSVPHPVTAWHPPAASTSRLDLSGGGGVGGGEREREMDGDGKGLRRVGSRRSRKKGGWLGRRREGRVEEKEWGGEEKRCVLM